MNRHLDTTPRPGPAAFPITPQTSNGRSARQRVSNALKRQTLATPVKSSEDSGGPLIPVNILDAPTQRLFVAAIYGILFAAKFWNWLSLSPGPYDTDGFWQFMQWLFIDLCFISTVAALRIPWLSWSPATGILILVGHAVFDAMLMFQIGLPFAWVLQGLVKMVWDRELTLSDHSVQPFSLVDPSSLIVGKQVINILPEGSAILNPHNQFFCIGGSINQVQLPIQINQTQPVLIELLRQDFDSEHSEVLSIKASEAKKLRKAAVDYQKKTKASPQPHDPLLLRYTVRSPGRYTIKKVVDETKLAVRPKQSEVLVVECPSARIRLDSTDRCKGELSNVAFEVKGTPPLKMKYRRLVNGNPSEASFQSIQPDDYVSPMNKRYQAAVVQAGDKDFSWAKSYTVTVPINETMMVLGKYSFIIDEVQDAFGNQVVYSSTVEDDEINRLKHPEIIQSLAVYDRPLIWIPKSAGCNSEKPIRVAAGKEAILPHLIASVGKTESEVENRNDYIFDEDHIIEYEFTPEDQLSVDFASRKEMVYKVKKGKPGQIIPIKEPGLYALKGISTGHCKGEVVEPSACLLQNPAKPNVKMTSSEITHKCANSPIGLRVDFEFEGSPPFTVRYTEDKDNSKKFTKSRTFDGHRDQIELIPTDAGHYRYSFNEVKDRYYDSIKLNEVLHQDVRPSASANIDQKAVNNIQDICIGQDAEFTVYLIGDAPWTLEYEIIHGKSKRKIVQENIKENVYKLLVDGIKDGGEYTLSLTSVSDQSGCKEFLKAEAKFQVWSQVPTAGFGLVSNKRSAQILEGKSISIPLTFTGQPSFGFSIENIDTKDVFSQANNHANGAFSVKSPGTYVIKEIKDRFCPGVVDSAADTFVVNFIDRPSLALSQHPTINSKGAKHIKQEVCEGDEDFTELTLQGMYFPSISFI
jgi:nucleoporin POM152